MDVVMVMGGAVENCRYLKPQIRDPRIQGDDCNLVEKRMTCPGSTGELQNWAGNCIHIFLTHVWHCPLFCSDYRASDSRRTPCVTLLQFLGILFLFTCYLTDAPKISFDAMVQDQLMEHPLPASSWKQLKVLVLNYKALHGLKLGNVKYCFLLYNVWLICKAHLTLKCFALQCFTNVLFRRGLPSRNYF